MKHRLATALLVTAALVAATLAGVTTTAQPAKARDGIGPGTSWPVVGYGYSAQTELTDNAILRWDERTLEGIRATPRTTGPTAAARAIGIVHTATYDAWAAYDPVAVDTRQRLRADPTLRRAVEGTGATGLANKTKAISFAAYTVLVDLFPGQQPELDAYMTSLYGSGFASDPDPAARVGVAAGEAVRDFRRTDGSNPQPGVDWVTNKPVRIYPNNTTYRPTNTWDNLIDASRWQPLCVPNPAPSPTAVSCGDGRTVQGPATPQWKNVAPFGPLNPQTHYPLIQGNDYYTPPGPPSDPSDIDLELKDSSNLSETQKAKADYWADGPHSEFPPGHNMVFAQALSRMRKNTLDQDVKLFFALGSAQLDASISAWAAKYQYESARPISAIRKRYEGKMVNSWLGPGKGYGSVLGQNWLPYQEPTVVTPPFPEYVSGHSTFSAAGRTVLLQFYNNNDAFNAKVVILRGTSKIEPGIAPSRDITVTWKTLSDAADDAGWSRRWGGIHFYSGDQHARGLGRLIGLNVWKKALTYFDGSATDQV